MAVISTDFGGLSRAEITANFDHIRDLYVAKIRYEIYTKLVPRADAANTDLSALAGPVLFGANGQQLLLFAASPNLVAGTKRATDEATAYAEAYWGVLGDGHRGNAYKHALWNALIAKHTGEWSSTVDGPLVWAKRFTDAHEFGSDPPADPRDRTMDLYNNLRGREVFRSYARLVWAPLKIRNEVHAPDAKFFADLLRSNAERAVRFNESWQLSGNSSSLVYFRTGIPVHRLYHPSLPDHFYTTTLGEGVVDGWRPEANGYFHLYREAGPGYVAPLYRCWVNQRHYVSLDAICEANTFAERVLGYVSTTQLVGTRPLYRLIHPVTRDRLTTWDPIERDRAVQVWNYRFERITGYAWILE